MWDKKNIKVVILSRGRSETITSHKLFPYADLIVPSSEVDKYTWTEMNIVKVPDEIVGLGMLRNWVLDNYKEKIIIMCDDDTISMGFFAKLSYKNIIDPDIIYQVLVNTALMASENGMGVFGFNQSCDVRKYQYSNPFLLKSWVGGVIGIVGRDIRFLDRNKFKVDIDYCLENLLKKRILLVDNRYGFFQKRDKNKGGNSLFRTSEKINEEVNFLKKKWGKYFTFKKMKNTYKTGILLNR